MQAEQKNSYRTLKERDSGIELLKVFAIILIVISHTVQTLRSENVMVPYQDYVVTLTATTSLRDFILTLFSYFGAWGNTIFFVCSAWFLLRSTVYNKQKWFYMLVEIWVVSVTILAICLGFEHKNAGGGVLS